MTDGKDPDEFIKKNGKEAFLRLAKDARPFADYKLHILKEKTDLRTTEGSVAYLQGAAAVLRELSPVEADVYVKKIAEEAHISEGAIRMEIQGGRQEPVREIRHVPEREKENAEGPSRKPDKLEESFIRLMIADSAYVERTEPYRDVFRSEGGLQIYEAVRSLYAVDGEIDLRKLEDGLSRETCGLLHRIQESVQLAGKDEQIFKDCVARIEMEKRKKRENEIIRILSVMDEESDKGEIEKLTKELMEIQRAVNWGGSRG